MGNHTIPAILAHRVGFPALISRLGSAARAGLPGLIGSKVLTMEKENPPGRKRACEEGQGLLLTSDDT